MQHPLPLFLPTQILELIPQPKTGATKVETIPSKALSNICNVPNFDDWENVTAKKSEHALVIIMNSAKMIPFSLVLQVQAL